MKRYAVRISERVFSGILAQALCIARDLMENALAWKARLTAAIGDHDGHAVDEAGSWGFGRVVKRMVFEPADLIIYTLDEGSGVLDVIGIRHGMRLTREGEA